MKLSIFPCFRRSLSLPHFLFKIYWWPSGHTIYIKPFWGIYRMQMLELAEHVHERMNWLTVHELYDAETGEIVIDRIMPALRELDELLR